MTNWLPSSGPNGGSLADFKSYPEIILVPIAEGLLVILDFGAEVLQNQQVIVPLLFGDAQLGA